MGLVVVVVACTGSDPVLDSAVGEDGGTSSPDASSSGGEETGTSDAGVDADLPPKAEGKFRWASAYSTASLVGYAAAAGDAVVLTTTFSATTSFDGVDVTANAGGTTPYDFVVAKLNGTTGKTSKTAPQWLRHFSGADLDAAGPIIADDGGDVYVAGQSSSDSLALDGTVILTRPSGSGAWAFVLKLSGATGDKLWARTFSSSGDTGCRIAINGAHVAVGCTVAGPTLSYVSTTNAAATIDGMSTTRSAVYLLLDAADGTARWANAIGNADGNGASAIAVTAGGDVLATGGFLGSALEDRANSSPKPAPKGTYFNAFVTRLAAADGKMTWVSTYGDVANGDAYVQVNGAAYRDGRDLVIGGLYAGAAGFGASTAPPVAEPESEGGNAFLLAIDPTNGATRWQKAFGGATQEEIRAVDMDRWGYIAAAATYRTSGLTVDGAMLPAPAAAGFVNAAIFKWVPDGSQLAWHRTLVPTGTPSAGVTTPYANVQTLATHADGDVTIGGGFDGALDLGGGTVVTTTRRNAFVVHVGP